MPLSLRAAAELERRRRSISRRQALEISSPERLEVSYETWLRTLFPGSFASKTGRSIPFADHHHRFWAHIWEVRHGVPAAPYIAIWSRGHGKSTGTEKAVIALGARGARRYALYLCETQAQADKHVQSIAVSLESDRLAEYYPDMAERETSKYGSSRGWRRQRLWTRAGFVVDAIGLDVAARGIKIEDDRPDLIVFDDIDGRHDSAAAIKKKIEILTETILPAGTDDAAIIGIQNLLIPSGIFAQLAGTADFLSGRIVDGPIPAIEGAEIIEEDGRHVIASGKATWAGMDLEACQRLLSKEGPTAFRRERQHEVEDEGGQFAGVIFRHIRPEELPELETIEVWVDPAVTAHDGSDCCAIQADGTAGGKLYRLYSWEDISPPDAALRKAIMVAVELKAQAVGVETNQGGDLWRVTFERIIEDMGREFREAFRDDPETLSVKLSALSTLQFKSEKADASDGPKAHRWALMLADYETGKIVHVIGTSRVLEKALKRENKPYDLKDAAYWSWHSLTSGQVYFG